MRQIRFLLFVILIALAAVACGSDDEGVSAGGAGSGDENSDGSADGTRPSLAGEWVLSTTMIDGVAVELPAGASFDMTIEQGSIQGSGGCNSFGGMIDSGDDGTLSLTDLSWTEMACEPFSIMDFESAYLQALSAATAWEVTPVSLTFRGDGSELVYIAGEAPVDLALDGAAWVFDTIFDGEGVARTASTPRMDKPEVVMTVADGQLSLVSDDCGEVLIDMSYEAGATDGAVSVAGRPTVDCSDTESNMVAAVAGIVDATSFQIIESRLTFIGLPGETVGFRAEG